MVLQKMDNVLMSLWAKKFDRIFLVALEYVYNLTSRFFVFLHDVAVFLHTHCFDMKISLCASLRFLAQFS